MWCMHALPFMCEALLISRAHVQPSSYRDL